ncbi:T9SS type A sorting domain-containing protein, partial [bacterium]|nr:T9SS type A sorting domain-containing protein [bacterium]
GPANLTVPAGQVIERDRSQDVPANASAGTWTYEGRVGVYPDEVWDTDGFPFEKAVAGDGITINDWFNYGDELSGEILQGEACLAPTGDALLGVYPNPFNPTTVLSYELRVADSVLLNVYDIQGRLVATLVDGYRDEGLHEVTFDATGLAAGVYLYKLTHASSSSGQKHATLTGKMMLLK